MIFRNISVQGGPAAVQWRNICRQVLQCARPNAERPRHLYLNLPNVTFHNLNILKIVVPLFMNIKTTSYRMSVAPWDCFKGFDEYALKVLKILHAYITTDTLTD